MCEVAPSRAKVPLLQLAGPGSALHRTHKVSLQVATVATLPYFYEDRLTKFEVPELTNLELLVLEPHDLALSKLGRNLDTDVADVLYLAKAVPLDLAVLRKRFDEELRPYLGNPDREALTLDLWCEAVEEERAKSRG